MPLIRLSARNNSKSRSDFEFFRGRCSGSRSPVPLGEGLGGLETRFSSLKVFDFKSGHGLWNLRKSTLPNPTNNTSWAGGGENEGFQTHQNLVKNECPKPVGIPTGRILLELQGAAKFLNDSLSQAMQRTNPRVANFTLYGRET